MAERLAVRSRTTDTILVDSGGPRAIIAAPDTPELSHLGDELAAALHEVTGVRFPVLPGCLIDRGMWEANHVLVVGDMSVNRFASELYRRIRTFEDCYYPGPGGWVVRSVHDTWGTGTNCLIAAGSDDAGHSRAVEALLSEVEQAWPAPVGFLLNVNPTGPARESILELSNLVPYPQYAYKYLLTGAPEFLRMFIDGALSAEHADIHWRHFSHLRQLTLMPAWDLIEESPLITEDERSRIATYLLRCYRSHEGVGFRGGRKQKLGPLAGNHGTAASLNLYFAARYFDLRYELPECAEWYAVAHRFITHFWTHDRGGCDSIYFEAHGTVPDMTRYAQQLDDDTPVRCGMLQHAAERAMHYCTNTGYTICDGATSFSAVIDTRTIIPYPLFGRAAALLGDGRFQWWLQKTNASNCNQGLQHRHSFFQTWDAGIPAQRPTDLIGMNWIFVDPTLLAATAAAGELDTLDPAQVLDKLFIRAGLENDDAYMAFSGIGGSGHGHEDTGAVLWYEASGRVFLVDGGWLLGGQQNYHNSVVISRDSVGADAPRCMTLAGSARFGCSAAVASFITEAYNDTRWQRTAWWLGADRFIILDRITANSAGDYLVVSRWNLLGQSKMTDNAVETCQSPRDLVARTDAGLIIRSRPGSWKTEIELAAGKYELVMTATPGYHQYHSGVRLRVNDVALPDMHVTPGSPYHFTADCEPDQPVTVRQPFEITESGRQQLELSVSVARGVLIQATAVCDANGIERELPLDEWTPGQLHAADTREIRYRLAADDADSRELRNDQLLTADFRHYPLCEPDVSAWTSTRRRDLHAGDSICIAHIMGTAEDQAPLLTIEKHAENTWTFQDNDNVGLLIDNAADRSPEFDGRQLLWLRPRDGCSDTIMMTEVRQFGSGAVRLSFSEPAACRWMPQAGRLELDLPTETEIVIGGGETQRLAAGRHQIEHPPMAESTAMSAAPGADEIRDLYEQLRGPRRDDEKLDDTTVPPSVTGPDSITPRFTDIGARASATCSPPDTDVPVLVGTDTGQVLALEPDGQTRTIVQADGAIRCLATVQHNDECVVLAGSDDARLYAVTLDGDELFQHRFHWSDQTNARYAGHSEVLGLSVLDLDNDGVPELYVAANNEMVYRFDMAGNVIWEHRFNFGPKPLMRSWIEPDHIVLACDQVGASDNVLVADLRSPRTSGAASAPQPEDVRYFVGRSSGALMRRVVVADVDCDGEDELILASSGNLVRVFSLYADADEYPGEIPWAATKWEVWTGVPPMDICPASGGGLWVLTEALVVNRFDQNGKIQFSVPAPPGPLQLLPPTADDDAVVVVARDGLWSVTGEGSAPGKTLEIKSDVCHATQTVDGTRFIFGADGGVWRDRR